MTKITPKTIFKEKKTGKFYFLYKGKKIYIDAKKLIKNNKRVPAVSKVKLAKTFTKRVRSVRNDSAVKKMLDQLKAKIGALEAKAKEEENKNRIAKLLEDKKEAEEVKKIVEKLLENNEKIKKGKAPKAILAGNIELDKNIKSFILNDLEYKENDIKVNGKDVKIFIPLDYEEDIIQYHKETLEEIGKAELKLEDYENKNKKLKIEKAQTKDDYKIRDMTKSKLFPEFKTYFLELLKNENYKKDKIKERPDLFKKDGNLIADKSLQDKIFGNVEKGVPLYRITESLLGEDITTDKIYKLERFKIENKALKSYKLKIEEKKEEEPKPLEDPIKLNDDSAEGLSLTGIGLTGEQLNTILHSLPGFMGVYNKNTIFDINKVKTPIFSLIYFYENYLNGGTNHWTSIYGSFVQLDERPNEYNIEYYDSYGGEPQEGIKQQMIKAMRNTVKNSNPILFKINKVDNQMVNTSNCGIFACWFLVQRTFGITFKDATGFKNLTKNQKQTMQARINFKYY